MHPDESEQTLLLHITQQGMLDHFRPRCVRGRDRMPNDGDGDGGSLWDA